MPRGVSGNGRGVLDEGVLSWERPASGQALSPGVSIPSRAATFWGRSRPVSCPVPGGPVRSRGCRYLLALDRALGWGLGAGSCPAAGGGLRAPSAPSSSSGSGGGPRRLMARPGRGERGRGMHRGHREGWGGGEVMNGKGRGLVVTRPKGRDERPRPSRAPACVGEAGPPGEGAVLERATPNAAKRGRAREGGGASQHCCLRGRGFLKCHARITTINGKRRERNVWAESPLGPPRGVAGARPAAARLEWAGPAERRHQDGGEGAHK